MPDLDNTAAAEVTGKIMVVAIIILFIVVIFVMFLHLYAKWFWWQTEEEVTTNPAGVTRVRRRFVFTPGQENATLLMKRGLDPAVLRSLKVVVVNLKECEEGLECAVCLCELVDGDKARMLPKCKHGFHVECIDMWFQSHSTCPLCRNAVAMESESCVEMTPLEDGNVPAAVESQSYPTNVLFWGNEVEVSSGANGGEEASNGAASTTSLATSHVSENSSSLSSLPSGTRFNEEEQKSQFPTRLKTLKRLLSKDRRVVSSSSSSVDIEQGMSRS